MAGSRVVVVDGWVCYRAGGERVIIDWGYVFVYMVLGVLGVWEV